MPKIKNLLAKRLAEHKPNRPNPHKYAYQVSKW